MSLLDVICVLTAVGQLISMAHLHIHSRPIYPLIILVYIGYCFVELYLASQVSWWVAVFLLVNVWGIASAVVGWRQNWRWF